MPATGTGVQRAWNRLYTLRTVQEPAARKAVWRNRCAYDGDCR